MLTEQEFKDKYSPEVKGMTLEKLPDFQARMLAEELDYGTICYAVAYSGAAAAWAVEHSPQGGITGFQAGMIGWELLRQWGEPGLGKISTRLVNYDDLLYPQMADKFTTISKETWQGVQAAATTNLADDDRQYTSSAVIAHWQSIVDGVIPFGLRVVE